jgi:hypothetical protein
VQERARVTASLTPAPRMSVAAFMLRTSGCNPPRPGNML